MSELEKDIFINLTANRGLLIVVDKDGVGIKRNVSDYNEITRE